MMTFSKVSTGTSLKLSFYFVNPELSVCIFHLVEVGMTKNISIYDKQTSKKRNYFTK